MKHLKSHFWAILVTSLLAPTIATAQQIIQVPSQTGLQQAINQVPNGGIVEIASGTYTAPSGGFQAGNLSKSFTIRAASGANVVLSGNNSTDILRISNTSQQMGGPITLERLTFANGRSNSGAFAAGLTLVESRVSLINCTFQNNVNMPGGGGGGGAIASNAADITISGSTFTGNSTRQAGNGGAIRSNNTRLLIVDSTFSGNDAWESGGAIVIGGGSRAYVHNSQFNGNRVNLPNHFIDSLGGAIFVVDSFLSVTNTRFSANQAGGAGGAIYAFGTWTEPLSTPRVTLITANSTFIDNVAQRDASVPSTSTTSGGAIQIEDHVTLRSFNSRFITNTATNGGGIASYRSLMEIHDSVFQGNRAVGLLNGQAWGGAIASASDDQDALDGTVNRRSAGTTIRNSLFQGRYGSVGLTGRNAGCIFAEGDANRAYGLYGNTQSGTIASNRAPLDIANSVFYDCDVQENQGGGFGGGIFLQLADANIRDTIFAGCDANAGATNTGSGGAVAMFDNSAAVLSRVSIVRSSAGLNGGAIWSQGSRLDMSDSFIAENQLSGASRWGGAAIWSGFENLGAPRPGSNATGLVRNNIFNNNNTGGSMILDYDAAAAPYNLMQYSANNVYPNNNSFYSNGLSAAQTVAQVNSLVLHGQAKAPAANAGLPSAQVVTAIQAVPSRRLAGQAAGDPVQPTATYVGYIWSGGSATLDGNPVSGEMGLSAVAPGVHTVQAGASTASSNTVQGATPATSLAVRPEKVGPGGSVQASWNTLAGSFLDQYLDQGAQPPLPSAAAGSVTVSGITASRIFRSLLVSEEGGALTSRNVVYIADLIFADGLQ